ncbi:MAG: hypothetical protein ACOY3N_23360 [Bradyrhizobium sp.]|uniref:hypothetical protein n=1 Tax=Bradyrhizobium sp. TaxID=376 RepID=UPI003BF0BCBA
MSWLDASTVIENEAGRRRIRIDELTAALAEPMAAIEHENVASIVRRLRRELAAFEVVSRLIERMRDPYIADRLRELAEAEAREADVAADQVQGE